MFRKLRLPLAVALVVGMLAACGGPGKSADEADSSDQVTASNLPDCPISALDKAKGPVKVEFWYGGLQGDTLTTMKAQIDAFNKSQDKVVVTGQDQGNSYDLVQQKYNGAIRTKQLPSVVYLENTSLQAMMDSHTLVPAEACMKADGYDKSQIVDSVREYYSVNDVLWPGYFNVSEPVIYYNKAAFKKAGLDPEKPPGNLEEIRAAAEKLKASGVPQPLALSLKRWFMESWLEGAGVSVVNNNDGRDGLATKGDISNPTTKKVLDWMQGMNKDGLLLPVSNTGGNIDQYTALLDKSAMTIETSAAATTITGFLNGDIDGNDIGVGNVQVDPTKLAAGNGPFPGVTDPGKVSVGGGAFFLVDPKANGQSPETLAAAWEFLKFQLQKEQGVNWHVGTGYLPVVKGVREDPKVQEFWKTSKAGPMLQVAAKELDSIDTEKLGPLIGPYTDYGKALENMLQAVAFENKDPTQSMEKAQTEVDAALKQYADDNGG